MYGKAPPAPEADKADSVFVLSLGDDAVLLAAPCRSMAGAEDLALSLPCRTEGDTRIRVGLVHGSTFDMGGQHTRCPIARDATVRFMVRANGLSRQASRITSRSFLAGSIAIRTRSSEKASS